MGFRNPEDDKLSSFWIQRPAIKFQKLTLFFRENSNQCSIVCFRHNDLPWQFRRYANNSVYSVNLEQDMRVTWNNETPYNDKSFARIPSQTDIPRLRAGKVGGQVRKPCCAYLQIFCLFMFIN